MVVDATYCIDKKYKTMWTQRRTPVNHDFEEEMTKSLE